MAKSASLPRAHEMVGAHPAWLRWLPFPLILGATLAAGLLLQRTLGPPLTVVVVEAAAGIAIIITERLMPYRRRWLRSHDDLRTDLTHAVVSGIGATRVMRPAVDAFAVAVAGRLALDGVGSPWPTSWPLLAQLALALVIAELPQYWLHRLQHESESLWRFHAVHHSAPRLYWLNAARFHPVDLLLLYAVGYLPLLALGCPEEVFALFFLFDGVFGMLQHSNIDVALGPLNRVFSMAEPHRWHHARELEHANSNYGSNLTVWDVVFGTYRLPGDEQPPAEIGIGDLPRFPGGYLAQLAAPFRWQSVKRESAAPPTPTRRASS